MKTVACRLQILFDLLSCVVSIAKKQLSLNWTRQVLNLKIIFSANVMQRWTIELNFLNFFAPLLGAVPKLKQRTCNRRSAHPCYFLLLYLCYVQRYAFHGVKVVPRSGYFGPLIDLVHTCCLHQIGTFSFFFYFLSAGFSRMFSSVEHVCVFRPSLHFESSKELHTA